MALLEIENLRVGFPHGDGAPLEAVRGVSLQVKEGEILGLVGESGSGKSLTASSILRLLPEPGRILGGRIQFQGRDLTSLSSAEMRSLRGRGVSMVFQEPLTALNPVMTVGDQIAELYKVHGVGSARSARRHALEMLEAVKMPDAAARMKEYPHQLSGGMRQRVVIAMALALKPGLIIADEPTTALDVTIQAQILALLMELRSAFRTSIILISHNLGVIARSCDRVAVMYAGRIVEIGAVEDVFLRPRHPYTAALLASTPVAGGASPGQEKRMREIRGMVPGLEDIPKGCAFAPRCDHVSPLCAHDPELEGGRRRAACHHPLHDTKSCEAPTP
ncbi:ABC transporter ATP-binding protein [Pikeienuella sp. HZG-20]|uniref:ABC transporter ATP-binding protein n=1 Tax=Paludibacillus litoralis TaxID=3133267 RepID=UPI0030EB3D2C